MKKIFLLLFASNLLYSCATVQLESIEPMSSEIQSERSQQDLYVSANNWMVETFTNAKSVIQFSDKEAGVVTGKYSEINGAVVSVVVLSVEVELSSSVVEVVEEPPSLLLLQEMTVRLKRKRERNENF